MAPTVETLNKAAVRRLMIDIWGGGELQLIPELVSPDYVGHLPIGDHYGHEGVRIDVACYRRAFPDLAVSVDDLLAAGDQVVRRYTLRGTFLVPLLGAPASGKPVVLRGIAIDRLEGGMLIESWVQVEMIPP